MQYFFVYILKSIKSPNQTYIGFTSNIKQRLNEHNSGKSIYTSKHKPWELISFIGFKDRNKAKKFEQYLKEGSGHAFFKKRFA